MLDQPGPSGYKKTQEKKFLTTDEVLTALFEAESDSDVSDISFDSETVSDEEFLELQLVFVNENKLGAEACFRNTLLDSPVSLVSFFLKL